MLNLKNNGNDIEQTVEELQREKDKLMQEHNHLKNQLKGVSEMLDKVMEKLGKKVGNLIHLLIWGYPMFKGDVKNEIS